MKLYLILAFMAFTGCQANQCYANEPKPVLEQLTNAFWSYVAQLGQEVKLTQSADSDCDYAVTLKKQMDPMLEEMMSKITKEAEVLMEHLSPELICIRDKLKPYFDNLKRQIQQTVWNLIAVITCFTP